MHRIAADIAADQVKDPFPDVVSVSNIFDAAKQERMMGQDQIRALRLCGRDHFRSGIQGKGNGSYFLVGIPHLKPDVIPGHRKTAGTHFLKHLHDLFQFHIRLLNPLFQNIPALS